MWYATCYGTSWLLRYDRVRSSTALGPVNYNNAAWKKVRLLILERDGWRCQIRASHCTHQATEVDHIVPIRSGGPMYDPRNLRAACRSCNSGRRNVGRKPTPSRPW